MLYIGGVHYVLGLQLWVVGLVMIYKLVWYINTRKNKYININALRIMTTPSYIFNKKLTILLDINTQTLVLQCR